MFVRESAESLLDLDIFNLSSTPSSSDKKKSGALPGATAGGSTSRGAGEEEEEEVDDSAPLFWQPGKRGYYSPRAGRNTPERLNAFRNVGRWVLLGGPCGGGQKLVFSWTRVDLFESIFSFSPTLEKQCNIPTVFRVSNLTFYNSKVPFYHFVEQKCKVSTVFGVTNLMFYNSKAPFCRAKA